MFAFLRDNEGKWVLIYENAPSTKAGYLPEAAQRRFGDGYHFMRRKSDGGFDIYGMYDPTVVMRRGKIIKKP